MSTITLQQSLTDGSVSNIRLRDGNDPKQDVATEEYVDRAVEAYDPAIGILMLWRGDWSDGAYLKNDVVRHQNRTWICVNVSTSEEPIGTPADWALIADDNANADKMEWHGLWNPGTYPKNSVVLHVDNDMWISVTETAEEPVGTPSDWALMVNASAAANIEAEMRRVEESPVPVGVSLSKGEIENATGGRTMEDGESFYLTDGNNVFTVVHWGGEYFYERLTQAS